MIILADKPRRLLLGIDGRHRLLRLAALDVEPIGSAVRRRPPSTSWPHVKVCTSRLSGC